MIKNVNILCSFLLVLYFYMKKQKKYYFLVYLDNSGYKITNKQMTDYLDYNVFED